MACRLYPVNGCSVSPSFLASQRWRWWGVQLYCSSPEKRPSWGQGRMQEECCILDYKKKMKADISGEDIVLSTMMWRKEAANHGSYCQKSCDKVIVAKALSCCLLSKGSRMSHNHFGRILAVADTCWAEHSSFSGEGVILFPDHCQLWHLGHLLLPCEMYLFQECVWRCKALQHRERRKRNRQSSSGSFCPNPLEKTGPLTGGCGHSFISLSLCGGGGGNALLSAPFMC